MSEATARLRALNDRILAQIEPATQRRHYRLVKVLIDVEVELRKIIMENEARCERLRRILAEHRVSHA